MNELLTQVGVGGIFTVLVLREVFNFLSSKKNGRTSDDIKQMIRQVDTLYRWHDKEDEEGVKIWYVRLSLEKALMKLAESIELQTKIFKELSLDVAESKEGIKQIRKEMTEIVNRHEMDLSKRKSSVS